MAASACEELLVMKDGEIVERGEPKRLISSPENEHTKVLVAAMLRNERP